MRGTATAASIWVTGAIGMTVALRQFPTAILLSLVTFATLYFGSDAKAHIDHGGTSEEDAH